MSPFCIFWFIWKVKIMIHSMALNFKKWLSFIKIISINYSSSRFQHHKLLNSWFVGRSDLTWFSDIFLYTAFCVTLFFWISSDNFDWFLKKNSSRHKTLYSLNELFSFVQFPCKFHISFQSLIMTILSISFCYSL